jgi:hypothetical protein
MTEKMIDALANRNPPPKLVSDGIGKLPLYPAEYDWKEDKRVRLALGKVRAERTAEMWEELIRGIGDKHYCLTLKDKNETYALGNWTVGHFCATLGGDWLDGVCNQHLPTDPSKDGYPISLNVMTGGLVKWRKRRADKQLYELQIEVCEETIRQLGQVAGVKRREKDRAREKIEAEIATLRNTKRPIFTDDCLEPLVPYAVEEAKVARQRLQEKP